MRQRGPSGEGLFSQQCCWRYRLAWPLINNKRRALSVHRTLWEMKDLWAEGKWHWQFELCMQSIHTHGKKMRIWKCGTWKTYTANWFCGSLQSQVWDSVSPHLLFPQNMWLLQCLAGVRATHMWVFVAAVFINFQIVTGFNEWRCVTLKCMHEVTWDCGTERSVTSHSVKWLLTASQVQQIVTGPLK